MTKKRIALRIPEPLANFVELFRSRYRDQHQVDLSQNEAILALLRRGLQSSPEMPDDD